MEEWTLASSNLGAQELEVILNITFCECKNTHQCTKEPLVDRRLLSLTELKVIPNGILLDILKCVYDHI